MFVPRYSARYQFGSMYHLTSRVGCRSRGMDAVHAGFQVPLTTSPHQDICQDASSSFASQTGMLSEDTCAGVFAASPLRPIRCSPSVSVSDVLSTGSDMSSTNWLEVGNSISINRHTMVGNDVVTNLQVLHLACSHCGGGIAPSIAPSQRTNPSALDSPDINEQYRKSEALGGDQIQCGRLRNGVYGADELETSSTSPPPSIGPTTDRGHA